MKYAGLIYAIFILTAGTCFASGTLFFPPKGIDFKELKKQKLIKFCSKNPSDTRCEKLAINDQSDKQVEAVNE
jgi:hypothetical protein